MPHAEGSSMNNEADTTSGQSGIAHQKRMATLKIQDGKARKNDVGLEQEQRARNQWAVAVTASRRKSAKHKGDYGA